MRRLAILLAALFLGLPGAAFAQGAGDDQYQDPFGDEPQSQNDGGGGGGSDDGGLSDEPPVSGGGGSGSSGSGSSGSGGGSGTAPATGAEAPSAAAQDPGALPRTGSEPLILVGLGAAFLLTGVGLRLRTIDPDAF